MKKLFIIVVLVLSIITSWNIFALAPNNSISYVDKILKSWVQEKKEKKIEFSYFKYNHDSSYMDIYLLFKIYGFKNLDFYMNGKKNLSIGRLIEGKLLNGQEERAYVIYDKFCAILKNIIRKDSSFFYLRGKDILFEFLENLECPAKFLKSYFIIQLNPTLFMTNFETNSSYLATYVIIHELLRANFAYIKISDINLIKKEIEIYKKVTNDIDLINLRKELTILYDNKDLVSQLNGTKFDFRDVLAKYGTESFDNSLKEYIELAKQA